MIRPVQKTSASDLRRIRSKLRNHQQYSISNYNQTEDHEYIKPGRNVEYNEQSTSGNLKFLTILDNNYYENNTHHTGREALKNITNTSPIETKYSQMRNMKKAIENDSQDLQPHTAKKRKHNYSEFDISGLNISEYNTGDNLDKKPLLFSTTNNVTENLNGIYQKNQDLIKYPPKPMETSNSYRKKSAVVMQKIDLTSKHEDSELFDKISSK